MSRPKDEASALKKSQRVRQPVFAGMFYPRDAATCREQADWFVKPWLRPTGKDVPRLLGGIVPHAGWICSGAIAGTTIASIAASRAKLDAALNVAPGVAPGVAFGMPPDVVIVLGAIHTPLRIDRAAIDDYDRWNLPGSSNPVLEDLRRMLLEDENAFATDDRFHQREHAVEVELPLIESAWPDAAILPIEMPLIRSAAEVGRKIARRVIERNLDAVILASSDLTHYGPAYDFAPAGVGLQGLDWAKQNDRRLLDAIERFEVERIVEEVHENLSACGGGAIAAMLAACRELGATGATVLRHANSHEVLEDAGQPQPPDNAVGYASVVVM